VYLCEQDLVGQYPGAPLKHFVVIHQYSLASYSSSFHWSRLRAVSNASLSWLGRGGDVCGVGSNPWVFTSLLHFCAFG